MTGQALEVNVEPSIGLRELLTTHTRFFSALSPDRQDRILQNIISLGPDASQHVRNLGPSLAQLRSPEQLLQLLTTPLKEGQRTRSERKQLEKVGAPEAVIAYCRTAAPGRDSDLQGLYDCLRQAKYGPDTSLCCFF